jgi:UDP-N-acetylmuramate dehydrogenase
MGGRLMSIAQAFEPLVSSGQDIRFNEPLARHTYMHLGGPAEIYAEPKTTAEVEQLLSLASEQEIPVRILGAGANLLVSDAGVRGLVVSLTNLTSVEIRGNRVICGSGARLGRVIRKCCDASLGGLESLAGIPSTMGGAVAMNAGGRYGEIGTFVTAVDAVTLEGQRVRLEKDQLRFTYRNGHLQGYVVTSVELDLVPGDADELRERSYEILRTKQNEQPYGDRSAGCIFKNPEEDHAGRLIDEAGLKGLRIGGAEVSRRHANFIVNDEDASADDILALIEQVQATVKEKFDVALQTEVVIWRD